MLALLKAPLSFVQECLFAPAVNLLKLRMLPDQPSRAPLRFGHRQLALLWHACWMQLADLTHCTSQPGLPCPAADRRLLPCIICGPALSCTALI